MAKKVVNPYKFKELKVYGSLETLYKGSRKYRQVHAEQESTYINAELSFYNILFDEEDWETTVYLKAIDTVTKKEVCKLDKKLSVTKDQNIVYVRDGWGTPETGWWKKGSYKWEAYIGEKKLGEVHFFVVNNGKVTRNENPYFSIKSLKLFESPKEGSDKKKRKYLQAFDTKTTRFVNIEMELENEITHEEHFPLELDFYVYNDAGQLKGYVKYFQHIRDKRSTITFDTGYGMPKAGFWFKDKYTIEVIFMDKLIAVVPFEVGTQEIEFSGTYSYENFNTLVPKIEEEKEFTFDTAKEELEKLIGLEEVKKQLNEFSTYLQFIQLRAKKGFEEDNKFKLHTIFMGNPGTGKTTVARMLGKIYKALGLLSDGKVTEVGRAELVAEYIGQTAPKVKKVIEQARGGILFIDEAYALTNRGDDEKDFGREVIEVLLKEMSDGPGDLAIIGAGYTKEMQQFLDSNPGLASRFSNVIHFPDYTPDALMEILDYTAKEKKNVVIAEEGLTLVHQNVVEAYRNRDRTFGNARYVIGVLEAAKKNMGLRLMSSDNPEKLTEEELSTVTYDDVAKVFNKGRRNNTQIPIDEPLLQEAMDQLNRLIGLDNIKNEVHEVIKLVRYYRDIGRDLQDTFSLHTVFTGNPGTGKTTLARLLVKIYKALGILERGHLIECDRKALVAGFIGQTAIKTATAIESSMGGGLFIDEAYSLTAGGSHDYGREAIEIILKSMEDMRGEFMVIVAGYPNEMKKFMESNPGLKSRFDKYFNFKDYTRDELLAIAELMFKKEALKMNDKAKAFLGAHLDSLLKQKNKYFGNARAVRKIVEETTRKQHLRLAGVHSSSRTVEMIETVMVTDLEHIKASGMAAGGKKIGFSLQTRSN